MKKFIYPKKCDVGALHAELEAEGYIIDGIISDGINTTVLIDDREIKNPDAIVNAFQKQQKSEMEKRKEFTQAFLASTDSEKINLIAKFFGII